MPTYAALTWDNTGEKKFETGNKKGVLYVMDTSGVYQDGVAWNGLTAVTLSNSGADETALWADDIKYASLRSAEEFGATIEAYQCPVEFYQCDGSAIATDGVALGQQGRRGFGFSYVTTIGNDLNGTDHGYKIHLIYGATASPDAITLSWELTTTPVSVEGSSTLKPTAHIEIDSTAFTTTEQQNTLKAFEAVLYGSTTANARLPLPAEVITLLGGTVS